MSETKQLFRVLAVFIPFPFFWALFEQQGSRWIIQAQRMNGQLVSKIVKQIKPSKSRIDMIRCPVLALAPAGIGLRIKTLIHEVRSVVSSGKQHYHKTGPDAGFQSPPHPMFNSGVRDCCLPSHEESWTSYWVSRKTEAKYRQAHLRHWEISSNKCSKWQLSGNSVIRILVDFTSTG